MNKIVEMLGELSGRDIMTMEGVRAACRGLMHVVKYDRFQFARAYEYFQQCAGAKLEGQVRGPGQWQTAGELGWGSGMGVRELVRELGS